MVWISIISIIVLPANETLVRFKLKECLVTPCVVKILYRQEIVSITSFVILSSHTLGLKGDA